MVSKSPSIIDRLLHRRSLRRWARRAEHASSLGPETLLLFRAQARQLRRHLDRVIGEADHCLTATDTPPRPIGADVVWRPDPWRLRLSKPGMSPAPERAILADNVTLYHNCPRTELCWRQVRNQRSDDRSPFGLRLDVFRFEGSFLSLVIDMPSDITKDLNKRNVIQVLGLIDVERPINLFARLNIGQGPNVQQITVEHPLRSGDMAIEFDLAYAKMEDSRVERLWVDLILGDPAMNQISFRDMLLIRRLRAEL
jgi:hypothetical protein